MEALKLVSRWCLAGVYALLGALFAGSVAFLAVTGIHAFSLEPTAPVELLIVAGVTGASAVAVALGYLRRA